jgi:membrane protease YdiL (CAAX protease family)
MHPIPPAPAPPAPASSNIRDSWRIAVGYVLILAVLWSPRPTQRPLYILAVLFIVADTWMSFEGWRAMGLRRTNFLRSLWVPAVALAVASLAVLAALHEQTLHPLGGPMVYVRNFWGYAMFAFAQQWLMQGFFLLRFLRLFSTGRVAAMAAATLFALAHLPNPILTALTLIWGLAACFVFLRYRNLYTLAITHAILGICLAITVPGPVTRNMRVGLGYLTYPRHHPADQSVYRIDFHRT